MDQLVEQIDSKTGRKIYHYIGSDGVKGKIVSRKQHLIDLKEQGKLLNLNVEEISFKRKRSLSLDASTKFSDTEHAEDETVEEIHKVSLSRTKQESPKLVSNPKPGVGGMSLLPSLFQALDEIAASDEETTGSPTGFVVAVKSKSGSQVGESSKSARPALCQVGDKIIAPDEGTSGSPSGFVVAVKSKSGSQVGDSSKSARPALCQVVDKITAPGFIAPFKLKTSVQVEASKEPPNHSSFQTVDEIATSEEGTTASPSPDVQVGDSTEPPNPSSFQVVGEIATAEQVSVKISPVNLTKSSIGQAPPGVSEILKNL